MPYWPMSGRRRNAYLAQQAFAGETGEAGIAPMERVGGTGIALGGGDEAA
ncbi:hypothetical protein [Microvirga sp. BSC39]|nr:hypothetical protein [Microvirga sp. BSC39]